MNLEYLKCLGYEVIQNNEDKTIMVYKNGKPFLKTTWKIELTKAELRKYSKQLLDRVENIVILDSLHDVAIAMGIVPEKSALVGKSPVC